MDLEADGGMIPFNDYFEYYGPDFSIAIPASNMANQNTREYLDKCRERIIENLRHVQFAPSVQMQQVPSDLFGTSDNEDEDDEDDQHDPNGDDLGDTSMDEPDMHRERHPFPAYSPSVSETDTAGRQNKNPRRHLLHHDLSHEFDKGTAGSKDLTAEFENLDALSIRAE